jgi:NlpC/P60 family putative phage cell wall peptidase
MTREDIVNTARRWIGTPYRHQASLKHGGADCLGLLRGVWREAVGEEPETPPPYSDRWSVAVGEEPLRAAALRHLTSIHPDLAQPGDVLLFRMREGSDARHVAIVSGVDAIIHAYSGHGVVEQSLSAWWRRRIVAAFAFPGVE